MISMFRRPGLDPRGIRVGRIAPRLTPPGSRPEEHKGRVQRAVPYAARVRGGRLAGLSEKGTRVGFPDPWRPAPLRRPGPDPSDLRPGAKTAPWESLRRPGPDPSDLRPGA